MNLFTDICRLVKLRLDITAGGHEFRYNLMKEKMNHLYFETQIKDVNLLYFETQIKDVNHLYFETHKPYVNHQLTETHKFGVNHTQEE